MFASISHQLQLLCIERSPATVRQQLVDYIRDTPDMRPVVTSALDNSLDQYLSRMSRNGTWGDGFVLSAACRWYRLTVNVYTENGRIIIFSENNVSVQEP